MRVFSPARRWFKFSSGVLASLSVYFFCGREWAWARDARAATLAARTKPVDAKAALEAKRKDALQRSTT